MDCARLAVLRTVVYADLFDYPLKVEELRDGLFDIELSADEIRSVLAEPPLADVIDTLDGFVFLAGRASLVEMRRDGERNAEALLERYTPSLARIAQLPFVRLAAVSGAVAFRNAHDDDVDVFVVTQRDRAWSACLLITLLTRLTGVRRAICANYFLDEDSLALRERDLYTAHQLLHLEPVAGQATFRELVAANTWAAELMPTAYHRAAERHAAAIHRSMIDRLLAGSLGNALEWVSRRVLTANIERKLPRDVDPASVALGPGRLKLHVNDHRSATLERFECALAATLASIGQREDDVALGAGVRQ